MKIWFIISIIFVGCSVLFIVSNTRNCMKEPGIALAELAAETPFDAKTLDEVMIRNKIRVKKYFSNCD